MNRFRKLKIHTKNQKRSWRDVTVTEIRLEGKWLSELGFEAGKHVQVKQQKGKLVITVNVAHHKKSL